MNWRKLGDGFEYASPITYNQEYRQAEMEKETAESDTETENNQWEEESESSGKFEKLFSNILFVCQFLQILVRKLTT